jgi:hypothetical protein
MPEIKELAEQLGKDQEAAFKARYALTQMATRATAPGQESARAELAKALAAELNRQTEPKKDAKGKKVAQNIVHSSVVRCRLALLLAQVADAAEVEALVEAMKEVEVRDAARMALEKTPGPEATKALVAALEQVGPAFRAGVVNSLAKRRDASTLALVQSLAEQDADVPVRVAAVEALADFADPSADAVLAQCARGESGPVQAAAHVARIRLAGALVKADKKSAAAEIYRAVQASNAPDAQKKAAEVGLKSLA